MNKVDLLFMVVHFKVEEAAKMFKGFTIFNNCQKFGVDKEFGLKL